MGDRRVHVRRLGAEDAPVAAALHAQATGHTFFAALGQPFLRAYWRALAMAPDSVGFVATSDGQPLGFVVGTANPQAQRSWVIHQQAWPLLLFGGIGMLRHPAQALRFARTRALRYARGLRRYVRATPASAGDGSALGEARIGVLQHIMLAPQARGRGVGRRLATALLAAVASSELSELQLVTLAGSTGASGFWRQLGWESVGLGQDADGRPIERFRYPLTASPGRRAVATRRSDARAA